jgi:ssDNA-binding Zn-finger/Zn-ribbon topoisomerase 1
MEEDLGNCPICNKPLIKWYSCSYGFDYIGCSDIECKYQAKGYTLD